MITCNSLLSFSSTLALLLLWNTIEPASSTRCGICAPRCSSGLRSGCSSPSARCFGSRSPARKSQPPLQPVLVSISCASSSPPILTSGCGRWFCSRSAAVLSRSLHFFSSSLPRCVDVHPSRRLCSCCLLCCCASCFFLRSLALRVNKCAFCFCCCCGVLSFYLIFCTISCVMYFIFSFSDGFFFIVTIIS